MEVSFDKRFKLDLVAARTVGRYAIHGVLLEDSGNGTARAVATDGRKMERRLDLIPGERAWAAADRAAGVTSTGIEKYVEIARACCNGVLAEIGEDAYWEAIGVLPPICIPGGFCVSEAVSDTSDGRQVYLAIVTRNGRHFAAYRARRMCEEVRA